MFSRLLCKDVKIKIYKNNILPVPLHGCETLRTEGRRVFENRVLRTFGVKTGGWRGLNNEELHNLHSIPSIIRMIKSRRIRWAGNVAQPGEKRYPYMLLVEKPEGNRPLGRQRCRLVDNIKMDIGEI
jgi:hypothetical protein